MNETSAQVVWRAVSAGDDPDVGPMHRGYAPDRVSYYEGRIEGMEHLMLTVVVPWLTGQRDDDRTYHWAVETSDTRPYEPSFARYLDWGREPTLARAKAAIAACLAELPVGA